MVALMKSLCFFFIVLASIATLFSVVDARRFYAGGNGAWVVNPHESYNSWAQSNRFQVNDTLYFKYAKGSDSVQLVTKADYDGCNIKNPIEKFDNGVAEVTLNRSGHYYFISGNEEHCIKGQKLIIVVLAVRNHPEVPISPAKAPSTAQPPKSHSPVSPAKAPSTAQPPKPHSPVSPAKAPSTAQPPKSHSPVSPAKAPSTAQPPKSHSPVSPVAPAKAPSTAESPKTHSPAKPPSTAQPPKAHSPVSPTAPAKAPSTSQPPKSSVSPVAHSPAVSPSKAPRTPPATHTPPSKSPTPSTNSPRSSPSPKSPSPAAPPTPTASAPTPSESTPTADNNMAPAPSPKSAATVVTVTSVMSTLFSVALTVLMFA